MSSIKLVDTHTLKRFQRDICSRLSPFVGRDAADIEYVLDAHLSSKSAIEAARSFLTKANVDFTKFKALHSMSQVLPEDLERDVFCSLTRQQAKQLIDKGTSLFLTPFNRVVAMLPSQGGDLFILFAVSQPMGHRILSQAAMTA